MGEACKSLFRELTDDENIRAQIVQSLVLQHNEPTSACASARCSSHAEAGFVAHRTIRTRITAGQNSGVGSACDEHPFGVRRTGVASPERTPRPTVLAASSSTTSPRCGKATARSDRSGRTLRPRHWSPVRSNHLRPTSSAPPPWPPSGWRSSNGPSPVPVVWWARPSTGRSHC